MARQTVKLQSMLNVSPGATATQQMKVGQLSYDLVKFALTNVTPAQLTNLKLIINGIVVQTFKSGSDLQDYQNYLGYAADSSGYLSWYFVQPEMDVIPLKRLTKLGMLDVKTCTIEFDIDSGVTSPKIETTAVISGASKLDVIKKVVHFSDAASVSGINEFANIPTNGARIMSVHFKKNDINSVEVEANQQKVFDAKQVMAREIQKAHGKAPNSNYYHVDFVLEGDPWEALITAGLTDLRFKLDVTAAGAMGFYVVYLDSLVGGV